MDNYQDSAGARAKADILLLQVLLGEVSGDPYESYRLIREYAPVLRPKTGTLALSRYSDAKAALRHRDLGKPTQGFGGARGHLGAEKVRRAMSSWQRTMFFSNPPDHTRLRRLLSSAFTNSHIEQLRALISVAVDDHLGKLEGQPGINFMRAVALPLPAHIIARLLGIPGNEYEKYAPVVRDMIGIFEPFADADTVARAIVAQDELAEYFADLLAEKQRRPADDLLSRLAASRAEDALDDDEMIATAMVVFGAGFETTINLLGNGLHALLTHPDQLALLRERPELVPRAVEECLRFDPPVQLALRVALRPCTLAGVELTPGDKVLALIAAANRDPDQFTDPDHFDVTRDEGSSLAFSSGIHYCIGAQLARIEGEEFFGRLISRYRKIEIFGEPRRRPVRSTCGFADLPIRVSS